MNSEIDLAPAAPCTGMTFGPQSRRHTRAVTVGGVQVGGSAPVVVDETAPALRSLIAKAGAFLNSGGQDLAPDDKAEEAQTVIDRIIEQAGSRTDA